MNIFYYFTVLVCLCLAYVTAVPAAVPVADDLEPAAASWKHGGWKGGKHHGGGGGHGRYG